MFLQELSYEIDRHHDAYMEFMEQCLDKQDLLAQVGQGLRIEEKHLIYLELMIMEQVADWEVGTGNTFTLTKHFLFFKSILCLDLLQVPKCFVPVQMF